MHFSFPFSLREPPETPEELDLRNNFATLCIKLELFEKFEEGLKPIKRNMDKLKKSIEPFAIYYFLYICTYLPSIITSSFTKWIADSSLARTSERAFS